MSENSYLDYLPDDLVEMEDSVRDFSIGLEAYEKWGSWIINRLLTIEDYMFQQLDNKQHAAFERYLQESEYPTYVEQLFLSEAFYALLDAWKQFTSGNYSVKPIHTRQLTFNTKTYMGEK